MKIPKHKAHEISECSEGQRKFLTKQRKTRLCIIWSRFLFFIGFLALWQTASDLSWIDRFYFSAPLEIIQLFLKEMKNLALLKHIGITLMESGVSFVMIILISLLVSTMFWFLPSLGKMFEPFLIMLNSLPKSALAPLIIVWLGTGKKTIILCGISVGIFGCILNLYQNFAQTDPERLKLIYTLGGTKQQAFAKVVFPGNIPAFISISKVNIGLALVGVIIGEFLAGRQGLGYLIIYGSQVFKLDLVILSIVILCIIAMMIYWLLNLLDKKISR